MPGHPPETIPPFQASRFRLILLAILMILASPAGAGDVIYRYVDDSGVVAFTGQRDAIPLKYQASAQALDALTFQPVREAAEPSQAAPAPAPEPEFETPAGLSKLQKPAADPGGGAAPAPRVEPVPVQPAAPGWLDQFAGTQIPLPSQFQLGVGLTTLALIIGAVLVSRVSRSPLLKLLLRSSIMLMLGLSVYLMYFSGLNDKISQVTGQPGQQATTGKDLLDEMKAKTGQMKSALDKAAANNPVTSVIEKTKAATVGEANQAVTAANQANQQLDNSLREIEATP